MRVVIAEDQALLKEGLARLFADAEHEVVATVGDADRLRAAVSEHADLAVVDVRMPPSFTDEGIRAAHWIRDAHPNVGVLVLSQHIESAGAVDQVSQRALVTCSRTVSSRSASSWTRPSVWGAEAQHLIQRSWRP